jgi:predicted lactoylglutathione lyase
MYFCFSSKQHLLIMKKLTIILLLLFMTTITQGQIVKLGTSARIAISSSDIPTSYEFYKKFGFSPLEISAPEPTSDTKFLRLTDGQIILTLLRETFKSPVIAYFAEDLTHIAELVHKVVPDAKITRDGKGISEIEFTSVGGVTFDIHRDAKNYELRPSGVENPKCGMFGEFTIGVPSRDTAVEFFKQLGFDKTDVYNIPYRWAIIRDGNIVLGIHQNDEIVSKAFLTYFSAHAESQIQAIEKAGIPIVKEIPDVSGKKLNATFRSPDGVYFNVFYYAGKF